MKKLNNKGFAISTMLYGILVIVLLLISLTITTMSFSRSESKKLVAEVTEELEKKNNKVVTKIKNKHIIAVYRYVVGSCVDGSEDKCENKKDDDYRVGDIVRYEIDDGMQLSFNIISKTDDEITMQAIEPLLNSKWTDKNSIGTGPDYALSSLASSQLSQDEWNYVEMQKFSVGKKDGTDTDLGNNMCGYGKAAYNYGTLDDEYKCYEAGYSNRWEQKIRLITGEELATLCSKMNTNNGCPSWLKASGDTYWTMAAQGDGESKAWVVTDEGKLDTKPVSEEYALKPVVVIKRYE